MSRTISTGPGATVADRIREFMDAHELSVDEFAQRLGEKPQRVKDVFRGKQRVPEEMLVALARLGADVAYILTGLNAKARGRMDAVREATQIALKLGLPKAEMRAAQELIFKGLIAALDSGADSPVLTPRERALLDNYRHSDEEAQRALDKTSAALAQPVAPAAAPAKRPRKAG